MKIRFVALVIAVGATVVTFGMILQRLPTHQSRPLSLAAIRSLVVTRVPLGTTASQVNHFLSSDPFGVADQGTRNRWEYVEYDPETREAVGKVLRVSNGFFTGNHVEIKFFFNKHAKLVKIRVQEVPYGI